MIDIFAYLRVSGPSQVRGDGFPRQFIAIRKYCEANNLRIVRVFKERGVCGETELENRPALSALFNALESNGVKTVVIERIDRLARSVLVFETIIRDFQRSSYTLLSTCEPNLVSTDPTHEFIRVILAGSAQLEKKLLVLKLRGSRGRIKEKGRHVGAKNYSTDPARNHHAEGRLRFGWKPGEQETLQRMIALRAAGKPEGTMQAIADALNTEGRLSRDGKLWNPGTVSRILARQKVG